MLKKSKITIILVLVISFLMNSCHKEEELESINSQTAIKKRNISFEELNTKLNKYKKYEVHQGRAGGDEFVTSLETDNIVEYETEDKTTYTLKANTTDDNETNFTNIIFVEKGEELEKLLIQYEPTELWKNARLTGNNVLYSGNTKLLDFEGNVLSESQIVDGITVSRSSIYEVCYVIYGYVDIFFVEQYVFVEVECEDDEAEDTEIDAGDSGDGGGADTDDGGSTTSGTGTDGDSSNDNGTGDTADTGDDGDPIFTEPVFDDNDGDEDLMAQLNELLCDPINVSQFNATDIETIQIILDYLQESNSGGCSEIDFDSITRFFSGLNLRLDNCNLKLVTRTVLVGYFLEDTNLGQKIKNSFFLSPQDHLTIEKNILDDTVSAITNYDKYLEVDSGTEVILLTLNTNYLNQASDLAIVTTIFHELLHAYIINLRHKGTLLSTFPEYSSLNTAFTNYFANTNDDITRVILDNEMHDIFIDFIDDLAENIFNYGANNNINISLEYAKKVAWGSLKNENVFNANLNTTEQTEAINASNNEQSNTNAQSTKSCD